MQLFCSTQAYFDTTLEEFRTLSDYRNRDPRSVHVPCLTSAIDKRQNGQEIISDIREKTEFSATFGTENIERGLYRWVLCNETRD